MHGVKDQQITGNTIAMRASYRLTKPRTNDNSSPRSPTSTGSPKTADHDAPIHASYEDLKKPEGRHLLRQQLSTTFPEVTRTLSQESLGSPTMTFKDRFSRRVSNLDVGALPSAKSSSSTVDSTQAPKRTSGLPEKDNTTIDLEQAIFLLQELKKTATPQELVALHRALLPTRDVETVSSPTFPKKEERTPLAPPAPIRRSRSNLPPGLATRAGFGEDLLRKPEEAFAGAIKPKSTKRNTWVRHGAAASISSIAALDLADDAANPLSTRAATPSDSGYAHTGAYRHGTLRVTNGTVSPEPSIKTMPNVEPPPQAPQLKADCGYFSSPEARPRLEPLQARASIDVVRHRPSEDSLTIRDRILNSDKALQQRQHRAKRMSGLSLTASKDSLRSGTPLQIQTEPSRQSFDRESASPSSEATTPRFQQRWSHRASQISQEYVSDCELSNSPYEDKNAMLNFATRLSTVYDSDADDADVRGTPEAALLQLTQATTTIRESDEIVRSSDEHDFELEPQHEDEHGLDYQHHDERKHEKVSPDSLKSARPSEPQKMDSGYGSDTSFRSLRIKTLQDATRARKKQAVQEALKQVAERDETNSIADGQSLYTWEEVVKAPALLTDPRTTLLTDLRKTSQESVNTKKLHSLLQIRSVKRASVPLLGAVAAQESSDTIATVASTDSSPSDVKNAQHISKLQKKLQKPMPPSVKKQRKAESKKLKDGRSVSGSTTATSEVADRRVASEPPMVRLDLTDMSLDFTMTPEKVASTPVEGSVAKTAVTVTSETVNADIKTDADADDNVLTATADPIEVPSVKEEKRSTSPRRSDSRGRQRKNSDHHDSTVDEAKETGRSWSIIRGRNKSQSRARSQTPKRSSLTAMLRKSSEEQDRAVSPGEDIIPAYSDFTSVARTLGSGSYDIATNQTQRITVHVPGAVQHQIQSPYMISTGLIKSKSMKGMNEEAASELARLKSRDVAGHNATASHDRPRMAAPKLKKSKSSSNANESTWSVEDRFPEWQCKPAEQNSPKASQKAARSYSLYAESIPPMPELPADVEVKVSKADVMVAKKLAQSARSTPSTSARNSGEHLLTQQKPESETKAAHARKGSEVKLVDEKTLHLLHPVERAVAKQEHITVEVREVNGSSSDVSTAAAVGADDASGDETPLSPSHEARHPGWVGWEEQAKRWRERRESLGAALGRDAEEQSVMTADSPPMSRQTSLAVREPAKLPSISVQRYITPLGADNAARANAGHRAATLPPQPSQSYFGMHVDDKENRPAKPELPRSDTAFSTSTTTTTSSFVTVKTWNPVDPRPAKEDVPRTDSAYSTKSYQTAASNISRAKSPGGHVRTPSGNFLPYAQSHAAMAERSRQIALAKLNGMPNASTPSSERVPRKPKSSPEALVDRYSGGLDYGWERGAGFNGSAGTRGNSTEAQRKSVRMSNQYGLDLSDVPVFLQRNG